MPTTSKKVSKKQPAKRLGYVERLRQRHAAFMSRRPHRSFRLTRRRDYVRPLELPGMIAFTVEVSKTLWKYKKIFSLLTGIYIVIYGVLVGLQSQETYAIISSTLQETGSELFTGGWSAFEQTGGILLSIATLGLAGEVSEGQQIFTVLLFLLVWLAVVWLLRNLLAGNTVKLRDGLYNSGAPLFAMVVVSLFIAIQLIPVALAMIGYSAASATGMISAGGAPAMLFWIATLLLTTLSLYWITSSLFAMIIVTLPGMYPYQAMKSASDLLQGRKLRILMRWVWMGLVIVVSWALVLIPFILIDMGLKSAWPAIEWLPVVPFAILILTAISVVWGSAYVYLLYRKVVDYVPNN